MATVGSLSAFAAVLGFTLVFVLQLVEGQQVTQARHCPEWDYPPTSPNSVMFRPNPARVFPLCVQREPDSGNYDPVIVKHGFDEIIDKINEDMNKDGWLSSTPYAKFKYEPADHFFKTNNLKQALQDSLLYHRYIGKDGSTPPKPVTTRMDNWVHVELINMATHRSSIGVKRRIVGFYAQAISGPLGIPFGEFPTGKVNQLHKDTRSPNYNDHGFNCGSRTPPFTSCPQPHQDYQKHLRSFPCTFHSKAGLSIPEVLLWSTKADSTAQELTPDERITFTFKWDENVCAEVSFFQFMFIFVYDWATKDYYAGLSPIFQPFWEKQPSSTQPNPLFHTNGLAYPFYRHWYQDELELWNKNKASVAEVSHNPDMRIVSNLEYEACVQHHVHLNKNAVSRQWECPPGPFQCDPTTPARPARPEDLADAKERDYDKWKAIYMKYDVSRGNCTVTVSQPSTTTSTTTTTATSSTTPIHPPSPTTPTPKLRPNTIGSNVTNAASVASRKIEKQKKITHGDLTVYIWLVLIPTSNFISRYYSDFANIQWIGLGWWIILHIFLHHVSIALVWLSFGLVVSDGRTFFGNATIEHYLFGFAVLAIEHVLLFTGHQRHNKLMIAHRQSLVHAILGYFSTIVSVFCATTMHPEVVKTWCIYAMFFVNFLAHVVANFVQWRITRALGMFPARKFFPVLERVMMVNTQPRRWKLRVFLGLINFVILNILFAIYWLWDDEDFQTFVRKS